MSRKSGNSQKKKAVQKKREELITTDKEAIKEVERLYKKGKIDTVSEGARKVSEKSENLSAGRIKKIIPDKLRKKMKTSSEDQVNTSGIKRNRKKKRKVKKWLEKVDED